MRSVPNRCPICSHHEIVVSRIECPHCQSTVTGSFQLPRLNRLTSDQLLFVEIFMLHEGKINRVEQEMGLSYAAVRTRLEEVIQALGGQSPSEEQPPSLPTAASSDPGRRKEILARVSAGELSATEAAALLRGD